MKLQLFVRPESNVKFKQKIYGRCKGPVQVYILSNDGLYYLQDHPKRMHGHGFSVDCVFGLEEALTKDHGFEIIAVETDERPESPQKEIPKGVKKRVRVWRRL